MDVPQPCLSKGTLGVQHKTRPGLQKRSGYHNSYAGALSCVLALFFFGFDFVPGFGCFDYFLDLGFCWCFGVDDFVRRLCWFRGRLFCCLSLFHYLELLPLEGLQKLCLMGPLTLLLGSTPKGVLLWQPLMEVILMTGTRGRRPRKLIGMCLH